MKTSVVTVPAKRRQVSRLLGNFIRARVVLAHLAAAFVLPFNITLTMLTAFGLPRSASPSQLVNVNGLLLFVVNMDYSGGELWRSDSTTVGTFPVKKGMPSSEIVFYPTRLVSTWTGAPLTQNNRPHAFPSFVVP